MGTGIWGGALKHGGRGSHGALAGRYLGREHVAGGTASAKARR
jgi:hypothetical protein